jgi:hypothetical protein
LVCCVLAKSVVCRQIEHLYVSAVNLDATKEMKTTNSERDHFIRFTQ